MPCISNFDIIHHSDLTARLVNFTSSKEKRSKNNHVLTVEMTYETSVTNICYRVQIRMILCYTNCNYKNRLYSVVIEIIGHTFLLYLFPCFILQLVIADVFAGTVVL
jgi:hypothetical protein